MGNTELSIIQTIIEGELMPEERSRIRVIIRGPDTPPACARCWPEI
jgi:hypothetical protein